MSSDETRKKLPAVGSPIGEGAALFVYVENPSPRGKYFFISLRRTNHKRRSRITVFSPDHAHH
jgi:hypothetical protein